jgi:hypothetical protein
LCGAVRHTSRSVCHKRPRQISNNFGGSALETMLDGWL